MHFLPDLLRSHPSLQLERDVARAWFAQHNRTYDIEFVGDSTMRNLFHAFEMVLGCTPRPGISSDRCRSSGTHIQFRGDAKCKSTPAVHDGVRIVGCALWFLNPQPFSNMLWDVQNLRTWRAVPAIQARACERSRACIIALNHKSCSLACRPCGPAVPRRACENAQRNAHGASLLRERTKRVHEDAHRCIFDARCRCDRNVQGDFVHFHLDIFAELRDLITAVDALSHGCAP